MTTDHRILLKIGWALIFAAVYFASAAVLLDSVRGWWIVAGLSLGVMLLMSALPEPVPRYLIIRPRNWLDHFSRSVGRS